MTVVSCLAVTAVVWIVSLIGPVRLRAFVYSLPIPMTLVLALTPVTVDGAQLVGVALLVVFFAVVATLHHRYRWPILLADAAGIVLYVLVGVGVTRVGAWSLGLTLAAVVAAWAVVNAILARRPQPVSPSTVEDGGRSPLAKLAIALVGSLVTTGLGRILGGLVVTFPYAGILVAVESRADLPQFTRHFARNSLSMMIFVTAYAVLQHHDEGIALAGGWVAFLGCSLVLARSWARPQPAPAP
jgi:hypothetical protein